MRGSRVLQSECEDARLPRPVTHKIGDRTIYDRRMLDRWLDEVDALVPAEFRGSNTLVQAIRVSQNRGRAAQFFRSSPDGREADFQMLRFEPDGAPNKRR
jgi:hypothetical protein